MTTRMRLLAIMVAGLLAVTACGSHDSVTPSATGTTSANAGAEASSSPRPATGDSSVSAVAAPERGTCWVVPVESARNPDYWFDDSAAVPCSEPHTTQTAWVWSLTEPTIEQAMEMDQVCYDRARRFLGVDPRHWVPWGALLFLPSEQEIANGASWVRCDVYFPATWDKKPARTMSIAAARVASDPPDELWACLDQDPSKPDQPFVPCDQPHQYEQTGTLAILDDLAGVEDYPSPTELEAAAQEQCKPADTDQDTGTIAVMAAWGPRSVLQDSTELAGSCFTFNTNGEPLEPRL